MEPKKRTLGASERRDEWLRAAWRALVAGEAGIDAECLVFSWTRWGRTPRSRPCTPGRLKGSGCAALGGAQPRQEHHAFGEHELGGDGTVCLAVVGGTTKEEVFEAYVERVLAPTLQPGQVVVIDNLAAHKGEEVRELVEARGCEVLFLPPYSPDYSPIEEAFSVLEDEGAVGQGGGTRTRETLIEALGEAISAVVTSQDARGFFEHCGYRLVGQLL